MTCFILPQTILNTPIEGENPSSPVSLNIYIKKHHVKCSHECVNIHQILSEFKVKYKMMEPVYMISDTLPTTSYSSMFNHTNQLSLHELTMLHVGGIYISKLMDSTTEESIQFMFKLASSFRNVCICKPESVCSLSSIKFVIATHFIHAPKSGVYEIPYYFKMIVDEMNSTYGQIQLEHLRTHNLSLGKI